MRILEFSKQFLKKNMLNRETHPHQVKKKFDRKNLILNFAVKKRKSLRLWSGSLS